MSKVARYLSFFAALLLVCTASAQQAPATSTQSPQQPAAASPQGAAQQPPAVVKVKTRLVIVDVVARNGKGDAIADLKPEDFTVLEDGKPQKISAFSFQHPDSTARPVPAPVLPRNTFNNLPRYQPNGALNVLLLDALNTTLLNQAYARQCMVKFLGNLPRGQAMAVYLLGNKLRLVQDFTSDPELLKKAALSIKSEPSRLLANPAGTSPAAAPMGSVAADLIASVPALATQLSQFEAEETAERNDLRVSYTLAALNSLARTLAGYPGRKNLIWVSETFPFDILLNQISARSVDIQRHYGDDVAFTGSLLADAQVAVYPVDARGLSNNSFYSVGGDPNPTAGTRGGLGRAMAGSMSADADQWMAARTTMNDLAEKTGGRAFYNRNDLDNAVLESIQDGSSYYTLGYYPENKQWNSEFRKIHVKLDRPGVKLHYRAGYFAMDREAVAQAHPEKQDEDLDQALALDWPIATGLPFQAQILSPSPQTENKVVIQYRLDPHAISFQADDQGLQHVNVLCAVRAYSVKDSNKPLKTDANRMAGPLKNDAYERVIKAYFPCQERFELPPGAYILRLGVRDNSTGLIGTANAAVEIASAPATGSTAQQPQKP
jgi:VWFA-related protein